MDNKEIKIRLIIDGREATAVLNQNDEALARFIRTANKIPNATRPVKEGLGSMNQVIGQTGFLLSDMDMFFVNWQMGLRSVSNNVSMVANTIGNAINEAKERNLSFGQALKQSLTGFNGWLLGINALLFLLPAISRFFSSSTEKIKEQQKEVDKLALKYEDLEKAISKFKFGNVDDAKQKLKEYNDSTFNLIHEKQRVLDEKEKELKELELLSKPRIVRDKEGVEYKLEPKREDVSAYKIAKSSITALREEIDVLIKTRNENDINTQNTIANVDRVMSKVRDGKLTIESFRSDLSKLTSNQVEVLRGSINEKQGTMLFDGKEYKIAQKYIDVINDIKKSQKDVKTLADQLNVTTEDSINKEISKLQLLLSQTNSLQDQLTIREKIKALEEEKKKPFLISDKDTSIMPIDWDNQLIPTKNSSEIGKGGLIKGSGPTDIGSIVSNILNSNQVKVMKTAKDVEEVVGAKLKNSTKDNIDTTELLGHVWQRTGNIISNSLTKSLGLLKQTDSVLQNIMAGIFEMALQMGMTGLLGGIGGALLPGGGGFWKGFTGAIGISKSIINTSETPLKNNEIYSNQKYNNIPQVQYLMLGGSVEVTARSKDLSGTIDKRNLLLGKFYSK